MAIDMIENDDLGVFAEGRLGLRQFADENRNYTGSEDFYNLFGSRNKKKATFREQIRAKYDSYPTDCANVQTSIDAISNDVATLLKQKSTLEQRERLDETNKVLGEYKNKQILQGCEALKEQDKQEKERASTLDTLTKLSDVSVSKAQAELQGLVPSDGGAKGDFVSKNKNLLIYGGIGVVGLVIIALILRRR
jgi:hypothetical protein